MPWRIKSFAASSAEVLALALTLLMPLKFASMAGAPEMPASYWFDLSAVILTPWPIMFFAFLSSILLGFSLFAVPRGKKSFSSIPLLWGSVWILLGIVSFSGLVNASAKVYAYQMIPHSLGVCAYAFSVIILSDANEKFRFRLVIAIVIGAFLAVFSGLYQYFIGFEQLGEYVKNMNYEAGTEIVRGQLASRIAERRVSGDFGICNTYGGFLAAIMPLAMFMLWEFGRTRVTPEKIAKFLLGGIAFGLFAFLILQSGSRGALFSVICGLCFFAMFIKMNIKLMLVFALAALCAGAFFVFIVVSGRGFNSMFFRFDYFQAAFRMMCESPVFGTGWGDFFHDFLSYKNLVNTEGPHAPHNFILLFGSQCGIAGFIVSLLILAVPCAAGLYAFRKRILSPLGTVCTCVLLIFAVDTLVEISFESPAFIGYFAAAGAIVCTDEKMKDLCFAEFTKKRIFILIITVLSFVIMVSGIFTSVYAMCSEKAFSDLNEMLDRRFAREGLNGMTASPAKASAMAEKIPEWNPFAKIMLADYLESISPKNPESRRLVTEAIKYSPLRASFYIRRAQLNFISDGRVTERVTEDLDYARKLSPRNPDYMKDNIEILLHKE